MSSNRPVTIYGLKSSADGVIRYVGQTVTALEERLKNHLRHARKYKHRRVSCWINSVVAAGSSLEVIVLESNATWNDAERRHIANLRAKGHNLANGTDGGDGALGAPKSAEARAKISAALKGRKKSPEHVASMAAAMRGKSPSATTRAKIAGSMKGRLPANLTTIQAGNRGLTRSPELRARISATLAGRQVTSTEKLLQNLEAAHGLAR